jgi:hypothetical protein
MCTDASARSACTPDNTVLARETASRLASADVARFVDVRRFAALDMWGSRGSTRRRRIIVVEFVFGSVLSLALGVLLLTLGGWPLGAWLLGIGINYVPLAIYAVMLSRPGALASELADANIAAEARQASIAQLALLVPLIVAVVAVVEVTRPRAARR